MVRLLCVGPRTCSTVSLHGPPRFRRSDSHHRSMRLLSCPLYIVRKYDAVETHFSVAIMSCTYSGRFGIELFTAPNSGSSATPCGKFETRTLRGDFFFFFCTCDTHPAVTSTSLRVRCAVKSREKWWTEIGRKLLNSSIVSLKNTRFRFFNYPYSD